MNDIKHCQSTQLNNPEYYSIFWNYRFLCKHTKHEFGMKYKFKMCVKKVDSLNLIYLNGQPCVSQEKSHSQISQNMSKFTDQDEK